MTNHGELSADERARVTQYTEKRLEECQRTGGTLTLGEIRAIRGVEQGISRRATAIADSASQATPQVLRARQQLAEAERMAELTARVKPGELLEVVAPPDVTGRRISSFVGDPEACWGRYKMPSRAVVRFNTRRG